MRGYNRAQSRFADFVVNRIDSQIKVPQLISEEIPEAQTKVADNQWNRIVDLHIVPHPRLTHPETIAFAYDMQPVKEGDKDGVMLTLQVRVAVAGDVLRRWNVDCSKEPNQKSSLDGSAYHL